MRETIGFKEELKFELNGKPVEPGKTPPLPKKIMTLSDLIEDELHKDKKDQQKSQ